MGEGPVRLPKLTEIAKGTARLLKYRDGELIYELSWYADDDGDEQLHPRRLTFPIRVAGEAGLDPSTSGDFEIEMRGTQVLRWARKYVEQLAVELQSE